MGKISQGVLGGFSGKVGNVVGKAIDVFDKNASFVRRFFYIVPFNDYRQNQLFTIKLNSLKAGS